MFMFILLVKTFSLLVLRAKAAHTYIALGSLCCFTPLSLSLSGHTNLTVLQKGLCLFKFKVFLHVVLSEVHLFFILCLVFQSPFRFQLKATA